MSSDEAIVTNTHNKIILANPGKINVVRYRIIFSRNTNKIL